MKNRIESKRSGYWCPECDSICRLYDQGLCCDCGPPWETEVFFDDNYPDHWVKVSITTIVEPTAEKP